MAGKSSPPPPPTEGVWEATGAVRIRSGLFGFAVLEEEVEIYFNTRRAGEGYSPGQWSRIVRWRRCRRERGFRLAEAKPWEAR